MRRQVNVYVEGSGDMVFMGQFLSAKFDLKLIRDPSRKPNFLKYEKAELELRITHLDAASADGGLDTKKINNLIKEIELNNIPTGIESVLILDSDTELHAHPPGGFLKRSEYLERLKSQVFFNYFLIPNNADNGNLESLLDQMVSDKGKSCYDCLTSYVNCLEGIKSNTSALGITSIKNFMKTKIEWYVFLMAGKSQKGVSNRNYLDEEFWSFEAGALKPLELFFNGVINP